MVALEHLIHYHDNGLNVQVPPFIESGDEIIIDTRNLEYIKKI